MDVQDNDWAVICRVLEKVERVLREAGDDGVDRLTRLRLEGEQGNRQAAVETLASGDMWGHMGSFFDRSLGDETLDRKFRRAQIELAEALESAGAATPDVRFWVSILRTWESQGF